MSEHKSLYAALGTHPYASANEIHAAFAVAKKKRDLTTTEGHNDFQAIAEAFDTLRREIPRATYDAHYLPRRAEAILEVIRLQAGVRLNGAEPANRDGELTNAIDITFKRIAVDYGVTREETTWICEELGRQHPTDTKRDADTMILSMSLDDIVMAIYAVRNNRVAEQAQEAMLAARKTPSNGFRVEARNPGAPSARPSAVILRHPMGYAGIAEAKNRELAALITDMLEHPKAAEVHERYKTEIEAGHFKSEWVIALAKANQTPHRIKNYMAEYRAVLGNIAEALYLNPALAFGKVFTDNISKYVFDGLAYSARCDDETQAFNLFSAVLSINHYAFTEDEFERYCFRDNSPHSDGGMLVKQAIELVEARHDLAAASVKGLVHKLYHTPSGEDPQKTPYTKLLDVLLEQGVVSHELLGSLDAANKRRDKTSEQIKHDKLDTIIKDAHTRVAFRPAQVRNGGPTFASDVFFID